jgi:hypothetical protein
MPKLTACCTHAGAGADMQWVDASSMGLLELAWTSGNQHTLPLLISMGVGWQAPFDAMAFNNARFATGLVSLPCCWHAHSCHNPLYSSARCSKMDCCVLCRQHALLCGCLHAAMYWRHTGATHHTCDDGCR